ncbi:MAG: hypothetical protein ACYTGN_04775 [Planctomycetota bacterium]|jgi:hypothetical protein
MLPNRLRLWLFDRLSVKTMRYVSAIPTKRATGLTKRVYDMIEDDFFINGSLTSRSTVPPLMAAIWTSGRETMLVDDHLDRTTKEAICGVLSDLNDCPYCGDMLVSLVDAGKEHDAATAIHKGGLQEIKDARLRDQLAWVEAVGTYGESEIPPCPFTAEELPEVLGSLMAMADINRFSHVVMDGSPVNLPFGLQRPALRMFGRELVATKASSAEPGRALDLLAPAELPEDLAWARSNPRIADSLARWTAAVERETAGVIPPAVRERVAKHLKDWNNELMPLSRSWVEAEVDGLQGEERAIARLALLLAKAPHQVSEEVVEGLTGDEQRFVRILAWASFTAARRFIAIVAEKARVSRAAPPPPRAAEAKGAGRRALHLGGALLLALVVAGCSTGDEPVGHVNAWILGTTPNSVRVLWDPVPGATFYHVFRNNGLMGMAGEGATGHLDRVFLEPDTEYTYEVEALRPSDDNHWGFTGLEVIAKSDPIVVRTDAAAGWEIDEVAELGHMSSLVLDASDVAHLLYCEPAPREERVVRHATDASGTWAGTTISGECRSDLALGPDGTLHAVLGSTTGLWAGRKVGDEWALEPIESGALALAMDLAVAPDGSLHVLYGTASAGLRYATNGSGEWSVHLLVPDGDVDGLAIAVGERVHVLFNSEGALVEMSGEPEAWQVDVVSVDARAGVDCAFGPDGVLHAVGYVEHYLVHFTRGEDGWSDETVDEILGPRGDASLAIGPDGALHVAYHGNHGDFKYATNAGGDWASLYIDAGGDPGERNSIALDSTGLVHVAYSNTDRDVVLRARGRWAP